MCGLLIDAGFAVVRLDLSRISGECVKYPESLSFLTPDRGADYTTVTTSAKDTVWYHWAKIVRRTITFAAEMFPDSKIGLVGQRGGAQPVYQAAAMDVRLTAASTFIGAGYLAMRGEYKYAPGVVHLSEDKECFAAGADSQAYAQFISIPLLMNIATNSNCGDIDRADGLFDLLPDKANKRVIYSTNCSNQISGAAARGTVKWLGYYLAGEGEVHAQPEGEIRLSEGKLYYKLKAIGSDIDRVEIRYSKNNVLPQGRYWRLADTLDTGEGEYSAPLVAYNHTTRIFVYANVYYKDGSKLSSRIKTVKISDDVEVRSRRNNRLLYDSDMGASPFFAKTQGLILHSDVLYIAEGPLGIKGIGAKADVLATYRIGEVDIDEGVNCLQFDAFSSTDRSITVKMYKRGEPYTPYLTEAEIKGGNAWCRVSLDFEFFVNGVNHLNDWKDVNCLEIGGGEGVLFNNFILV
jgi:hypothetical protein